MIGIIGAMEQEVSYLISQMESPKTQVFHSIAFVSGSLLGKPAVIAKAGVGKVNAALTAQAMCFLYHPSLIINTGVAGAIGEGLKVGDAVISDKLVEHDMDTTPVGDPYGLLTLGNENRVDIPADRNACKQLFASAQAIGLTAYVGTVATGDQFIATREQKERISRLFGALCCEMEGAAIAHACYLAKTPFCVLRVLSDSADGSAHMDYPAFVKMAAQKSADTVLHFLSNQP